MLGADKPATSFNVTYNLSDLSSPNTSSDCLSSNIFIDWLTVEPNSTCMNFTMLDFENNTCKIIFRVFVTTLLCFVGFLGNFATIAVLHRDRDPQRQKTTNWLLEILAIVDNIYLAFAFIFLPIKTIAYFTDALPTVRRMFPYLMVHIFPYGHIAHIMTIWIVVFVITDRYLAFCEPMHNEWRTLRRVKMAVLALFILAVIYNVPRFFETEVKMIKDCKDDELIPVTFPRSFVLTVYYQYIYEAGCEFMFRSVGPLVIVVILNVRISWALKAMNKKRPEMTLQAKEEKTLTLMLVVVVVVFIICQLPCTALSIAFPTALLFTDTVNKEAFRCAFDIAYALTVFNSSTNCFVYCLVWRKFNRILVGMLACRKENPKDPF